MQRVHNYAGPEATSIFLEELLNLHRGQGYDIYWRDNNECPTEEQYKAMVLDSAPDPTFHSLQHSSHSQRRAVSFDWLSV